MNIEYKTDPYFLQFLQSNMMVCMIIYMLCKNCELELEPEIVFVLLFERKTISDSDSGSGSQLLQNE